MNKNEKYINDYLFFQEGPGVRNYQYTTSGVKLLNVSNLVDGNLDLSNSNRYISNEEAKGKYKHFLCDVGDLIIASSGIKADYFDKKMGFVKEEMLPLCMNTSTIRFKPLNESDMNIKYFMYYLKSSHFRKQLEYNLTGSAQLNFGPSHLKKMKFIYHDISKQKEIVEKLDSISNMINLKKEQLLKLDVLIKSQFVEMFNDKTFEAIELNELCDVRDGTHDSPKYLDSSDYKFITSKNILGNSIDFSDCKYIKEDDYNKFNQRSKVNTGDILMPMIGTIGNPIIVNIPEDEIDFAIKNVALIKFNSNSKVINVYIKSLLNSDFFENAISQNKRGGTQKFIALSDIRKIKVPVPPIELQNKFAQIVEQIDKQKFEFEKSLKKLEELQASLMQEYFG